jgi:hypothetical protein
MKTNKKSSDIKASSAAPSATPTAVSAPAATPTPAPTPHLTAPSTTPVITSVTSGNNTGTKVSLQTSYLALIEGLKQYFQPSDVFDLPMGQITCAELIAQFQGFVTAVEATKSSNQAWRNDVEAEHAAAQQVRPYRVAIKAVLVGKYGKSSTKLLAYGFKPAKVPVKSTTAKSTAVAKSKATRQARGTKGKVQKQQIVGNVTGVVITPVTAGPSVPVTEAKNNNAASGNGGAHGDSASAAPASPAANGGAPTHS